MVFTLMNIMLPGFQKNKIDFFQNCFKLFDIIGPGFEIIN